MKTTQLDLTLYGWRAYLGFVWVITSSVVTLGLVVLVVTGVAC